MQPANNKGDFNLLHVLMDFNHLHVWMQNGTT